jgi:hypothetical protein
MSKPTETIENDDDVFMDDFDGTSENTKSDLTSNANANANANANENKKLEMTFMDKVKDYVSKNKTKLYILTPCYGSLCFVNYVL